MADNIVAKVGGGINITANASGGDNIVANVTTPETIKAVIGNALIVGGGGQIPELSAGAASPVGTIPNTNPHLYIQLTSPEWTVWFYTGSWQVQTDTGKEYLSQLLDVNIPSPTNGQLLAYNATTSKWEAKTLNLDDLADVAVSDQPVTTYTQLFSNTGSATPIIFFGVSGSNYVAYAVLGSTYGLTTGSTVAATNTGTQVFTLAQPPVPAFSPNQYELIFSLPPTTQGGVTWGGQQGTFQGQLWLVSESVLKDGEVLTWNATSMKWEARVPALPPITTTNTLTNPTNTITSTVNGVAATAQAVNTVTLTNPTNTMTATINGVPASATVVNTVTLANPVNTITSTVNGVSANTTVVNTVSNTVTTGAQPTLSTTVNGVTGTAVNLPLTPIPPTTNTLTNPVNTLTSTVDGVAATATVVNTVANTLTPVAGGTELVTTVNGVGSPAVTIPSGGGGGADTELREAELEPTGFPDPTRTQTAIAFNNATRTFAITPTGASFDVWVAGTQFTKSAMETIQIPNASGLYYIAYNTAGQLVQQTTYFVWDAQAPVAYVYWNATDQAQYFFADERHGTTMDWATHEYLHRTRGAAFAQGYAISGATTGAGNANTDAQFALTAGTFFDEDIQIDFGGETLPANSSIMYRLGTAWHTDAPSPYPMKLGTARPSYNVNTGGAWSLNDLPNNDYGIMWLCATNDQMRPIVSIMGQDVYVSYGQAQQAQWSDMDLTGLPIFEMRVLYKVIFRVSNSYTNAVKAATRGFEDWRTVEGIQLPDPTYNAIDADFRDTPQTVFDNDPTAQAAWQHVIQSNPSFAPRYDVAYDCVDNNSRTFLGTLNPDTALYGGVAQITFASAVTDDSQVTGIPLTWAGSAPSGLGSGTSVIIFSTSGYFNITEGLLDFTGGNWFLEGAINCIQGATIPAGNYAVFISGVQNPTVSALNAFQGRVTIAAGNNVSINNASNTITINSTPAASQGNSTSYVDDQDGARTFVSTGSPNAARFYFGMGFDTTASQYNLGGYIGATQYISAPSISPFPSTGVGIAFPQQTTYTDIEIDAYFPPWQVDVTAPGLTGALTIGLVNYCLFANRTAAYPETEADGFPPFHPPGSGADVGMVPTLRPTFSFTSLGGDVYRCTVSASAWRGVVNNQTLTSTTTSHDWMPYLGIYSDASAGITAFANFSQQGEGGISAYVSLPGVGSAIPNLQQVTNQGSSTTNPITAAGLVDSTVPATSSITFTGGHADVKVDNTTISKDAGTGALITVKSWIDYATRWSATPTNVITDGSATNPASTLGNVISYVYQGTTRYRFIPTTYDPTADAFYSMYNAGTKAVSGLITARST